MNWNELSKDNLPNEEHETIFEVEESVKLRCSGFFKKVQNENSPVLGTFTISRNNTGVHIYRNGKSVVKRFIYVKDIPVL